MKIASWNVNGIRAAARKGFAGWAARSGFDVILLQEVRAEVDQVPEEVLKLKSYGSKFWYPATSRKGYSGTGVISKVEPTRVINGIGREEFDAEGRIQTVEFKNLRIVNAYFPNSQNEGKRIDFKIDFCEALHDWINKLRKKGKPVLLCGDFNIAHKPIDLARPESNEGSPGYLPEERDWMQSYIESGWVDTFRDQHPNTVRYSWWSNRAGSRERNVGWRIDYHTVHSKDRELVLKTDIKTKVLGSDHCPVTVELDL